MRKEYINFIKNIYSYCDNNIEEEMLFPAFLNLWRENEESSYITKKDLAVLTSNIISHLLNKNVLSVIHSDTSSEDAYGFYKILSHENLVRNNSIVNKKI